MAGVEEGLHGVEFGFGDFLFLLEFIQRMCFDHFGVSVLLFFFGDINSQVVCDFLVDVLLVCLC